MNGSDLARQLHALAAKWRSGTNAIQSVPLCADELDALVRAASLPAPQLVTECCGVAIPTDHRFCPKCGYEARVESNPVDTDVVRGRVDGAANPAPEWKCSTCGKGFDNTYDIYRCTDCEMPFHRDCLRNVHFKEQVPPNERHEFERARANLASFASQNQRLKDELANLDTTARELLDNARSQGLLQEDALEFQRKRADKWVAVAEKYMSRESTAVEILRAIIESPYGCPFCDSGKLRTEGNPAKDHDEDCGFARATAFLAGGAAGPQAPPPLERGLALGELACKISARFTVPGHSVAVVASGDVLEILMQHFAAQGDAARVPPSQDELEQIEREFTEREAEFRADFRKYCRDDPVRANTSNSYADGVRYAIGRIKKLRTARVPPSQERERELEWVLDRAEQIVREEHGRDAAYAFTQAWSELPKELRTPLRPIEASVPPATPQGWQPIETAPKDGTWILVLNHGRIHEVRWSGAPRRDAVGWRNYDDTLFTEPTHWMPPLPAAPATPQEK